MVGHSVYILLTVGSFAELVFHACRCIIQRYTKLSQVYLSCDDEISDAWDPALIDGFLSGLNLASGKGSFMPPFAQSCSQPPLNSKP
eukprot:1156647-Pelagomonas_calceolata.AAC.15